MPVRWSLDVMRGEEEDRDLGGRLPAGRSADSVAAFEARLRPEMDRLRARADKLAAAVREHHAEGLQAQAAGDETRDAALFDEVERLNRRCNQALRSLLKLEIEVPNAWREEVVAGQPPPRT